MNVKPITLSIVGLHHYEADPKGAPQCEVYTPDFSLDSLVYTSSKHDVGESIPASEIRRAPLYDVYSYKSDTVNIGTRLSWQEMLKYIGQIIRLKPRPATTP